MYENGLLCLFTEGTISSPRKTRPRTLATLTAGNTQDLLHYEINNSMMDSTLQPCQQLAVNRVSLDRHEKDISRNIYFTGARK